MKFFIVWSIVWLLVLHIVSVAQDNRLTQLETRLDSLIATADSLAQHATARPDTVYIEYFRADPWTDPEAFAADVEVADGATPWKEGKQ